MTVESGSAACICCGSTNALSIPGGLLRCSVCGHGWADLRLSFEELRKLYSETYFKGAEYLDYERERPALRRNFRARVKDLLKGHPDGGRLWEIGCAYGYFIEEAAPRFDVGGCDISTEAIASAKKQFGEKVVEGDYLRLDIAPCDVVCLWDTVEHLQAPERYLEKAAQDLKRGGTLALSTGDFGSLCARVRGPKWRLIHPPTHLHYFTAKSITTLLGRLGFVNVRISHPPFWRSVDAVAHGVLKPERRSMGKIGYDLLRKTGISSMCFPLNLWDLMTVYAEKS